MFKLEFQRVLGLGVQTEDGFVDLGPGNDWTKDHETRTRQVVSAALSDTPNLDLRDAAARVSIGPPFHFGVPIAVETPRSHGIVAIAFSVKDGTPRELSSTTRTWDPPRPSTDKH